MYLFFSQMNLAMLSQNNIQQSIEKLSPSLGSFRTQIVTKICSQVFFQSVADDLLMKKGKQPRRCGDKQEEY